LAKAGYRRKLAAIFSADVADYSRLMGEDEAGTVQAIQGMPIANSGPSRTRSGPGNGIEKRSSWSRAPYGMDGRRMDPHEGRCLELGTGEQGEVPEGDRGGGEGPGDGPFVLRPLHAPGQNQREMLLKAGLPR